LLSGKALEEEGDDEATRERGGDRNLRPFVCRGGA
jgi:hypothetical protein